MFLFTLDLDNFSLFLVVADIQQFKWIWHNDMDININK